MGSNGRHIAVLTGDLVGSTGFATADVTRAFTALERIAREMDGWHRAPVHFTRQRGDGWQVVFARPRLALRSALAFRAALRAEDEAFDARQSVAEGAGPDPATLTGALNDQVGPMFTASGQGLDAMKSARGIDARLFFQSEAQCGERQTGAVYVLADHVSRGWTTAQAEAILPLFEPEHEPTYSHIAERLGKSRQAVTKAVRAAGWPAVFLALKLIEAGDAEAPH
ncbi:MAG TPA: hypothetical protein DIU07_03880 [Rhodobacteraceae bacterium]|nr:hypothetical protein [Paracoccaceae bacterium]